ncbi:SICAvar - type I, partial [Plasmodium knowlesi]
IHIYVNLSTQDDDIYVEEAWDKLKTSLLLSEADEITNLCEREPWNVTTKGSGGKSFEGEYKKDLCKGLMGIRYFMSGITEKTGRQVTVEEDLTEDQWFARCTVGTLALSDIYGDHCKLNEVISGISEEVEGNLKKYLTDVKNQAMIKKCVGKVDSTALMIGKAVLGGTIRKWAQEERIKEEENGKAWRLGQLWQDRWKHVCSGDKKSLRITDGKRKEELNKNKDSMVQFMSLGNGQSSSGGQASTVADILADPDNNYTFKEDALQKVFMEAIESASNGGTGTIGSDELTKAITENLEKVTEEKTGKY